MTIRPKPAFVWDSFAVPQLQRYATAIFRLSVMRSTLLGSGESMGYDITFHSISKLELRRYVFDILEDPSCAESRSNEVSTTPEKRAKVFQTYYLDHLIKWLSQEQARYDDISPSFAMVTAVIAGYLHPYHYSRNFSLSLISERYPEVKAFFTSLTAIPGSPLAGYNDPNEGLIAHNYAASGIVDEPSNALAFILRNESELVAAYGEDELSAIKSSLSYCIDRNLCFIEAAEVVFPLGDACFSDFDNFRASFLKQSQVNDEAPISSSPLDMSSTATSPPSPPRSKPWWRFW